MSYKALLFCSDEATARVVAQVLSELEFQGEPCKEPFAAVKKLTSERIDAMVVDCGNAQDAALLVKSARNSNFNQQSLFIALVDGKTGVTNAFRLGANLVLTKPVSVEQAKSTLRVARGLLHKNEAAKTAASAPAVSANPDPTVVDVGVVAPKAAASSVSPWAPGPLVSIPSSSMLEVEKEAAPKLEPAEAGLLESISETASGELSPPAWPALATKKELQSKMAGMSGGTKVAPFAESEKTATIGATETLGATVSSAPNAGIPAAKSLARPLLSVHSGSGQAAAAAPAPSLEPGNSADSESTAAFSGEPEIPATSSDVAKPKSKFKTVSKSNGSYTTGLTVAAVIVLVAAIGYEGWTTLHPVVKGGPAIATPVPPNAAGRPGSQVAMVPGGAQIQVNDTNRVHVPSKQIETQPMLTPTHKQSVTNPTGTGYTSVPETAPRDVLVVSTQPVATVPAPKPAADEPVPAAPAATEITSNSEGHAIPSLVTPSNASMPMPLGNNQISQGVAEGLLIKRVQPVYPPQGRSIVRQGAVEVLASIDKDGSVTNVKQLSGDPILGKAAMDAVKQWQYKPYLLDGQPVEIQTQITVNFTAQ
jgi:TonB family protein